MRRIGVQVGFLVGIVALVLGARLLYTDVVAPAKYGLFDTPAYAWWGLLTVVLFVSSYGLGLPELPASRSELLLRSAGAVATSLAAVSMAQLVTADALFPRSSIALIATIAPLWSLIVWNASEDMHKWTGQRDRVVLVADQHDDAAALRADLSHRTEIPAALVGVVSPEEARVRRDGTMPLVDVVADHEATLLVLDRRAQADESIVAQASELHSSGLRIRTLALFYEGWLGKLPVAELAQVSLLFDVGEIHRIRYVRLKRVFDVALGLIGLVGLALLLPVVVIVNRFKNRGPLFFSQERVGKGGDVFTMHKFRTMSPGGDQRAWTATDDVRVTPFGAVLRRLHLDELPQVVNVLRGELSIVGPRPEQVHYVDELRDKIPFYDARHLVRPGLTGWAQVKLGYAADEGDALEKLQYDFYYLRRQSLSFDIRIVGRTLREVLGGGGR